MTPDPLPCAVCHRPAVATLKASNGPELYGTCAADRERQIKRLLDRGAGSVQVTLLVDWTRLGSGRYRRSGVRR